MPYDVVIWTMDAPAGKLEDTTQRADAFRADVAATLPRDFKGPGGRRVGTLLAVRTLALPGGTVSVIGTVE